MNKKTMWYLLSGLIVLVLFGLGITFQPAGASPHQIAPQMTQPGDENWVTGLGNGYNQLEYAYLGRLAFNGQNRLYASGGFQFKNDPQKTNLAYYQNENWSPLHLPAPYNNGYIRDIAPGLNASVYVISDWHLLGWNGSTWTDFGEHYYQVGVNDVGQLFAVKGIGDEEYLVEQWNGSAWVTIGSIPMEFIGGPPVVNIYAMEFDSQNNLVIAGKFNTINEQPFTNIAKWNGIAWSAVGDGIETIHHLKIGASDTLYAITHDENNHSQLNYLVNNQWQQIQTNALVQALAVDSQNNIYIAGHITEVDGTEVHLMAKWDGTTWHDMGGLTDLSNKNIFALAADNQGGLFAAGHIYNINGNTPINQLAYWDGTQWSKLDKLTGQGFVGKTEKQPVIYTDLPHASINTFAQNITGTVYAGGEFQVAGDNNIYSVAQWNGTEWAAVGAGLDGVVNDLAFNPAGHLLAVGEFALIGQPITHTNVAMWNGTQWTDIGDETIFTDTFKPDSVVIDSQGDVWVPALTGVFKWDGTEWTAVGDPGYKYSLTLDNNGVVYALGENNPAIPEPFITYWNGTEWVTLPDLPVASSVVNDLAFNSGNQLYAIGKFPTAEFSTEGHLVMTFTGSNWLPVGGVMAVENEEAQAGLFDPNSPVTDTLYIVGNFIDGQISKIAELDNNAWLPLGSGLSRSLPAAGPYLDYDEGRALALTDNGYLFVGGVFHQAGGQASSNIAIRVLPDHLCGLSTAGTYTFYTGEQLITIEITTPGTLECIDLLVHQTNHPSALPNQMTGSWWEIVGTAEDGNPAEGYAINLTLTQAQFTADENSKLCLQIDTISWDCAADSFNGQQITRQNVTQMGIWTIEADLHYLYLPTITR